jgi:hypothetical protein
MAESHYFMMNRYDLMNEKFGVGKIEKKHKTVFGPLHPNLLAHTHI